MKHLLFALLCFVIASCDRHSTPAPLNDGQNVGNGGDFLEQLFEQGRVHAAEILLRMDRARYPKSLAGYLNDSDRDWLFAHREEISTAIKQSRHVWSPTLPEHFVTDGTCPREACACTPPGGSRATVYLSSQNCSATRRESAGELLLQTNLHRFSRVGTDEEKAYRLARAAYETWREIQPWNAPAWTSMGPNGVFPESVRGKGAKGGSVGVWTGHEFLLWYAATPDHFSFYTPRTNRWRSARAQNSFETWRAHFPSDGKRRWYGAWVADRLLLFYAGENTDGLAGLSFDPKTAQWSGIPAPEGWTGCAWPQLVPFDDDVFVWGGRGCNIGYDPQRGTRRTFTNQAAIFSPKRGTWHTLDFSDVLPLQTDAWALRAGRKVIIWGGDSGHFARAGETVEPQRPGYRFTQGFNPQAPRVCVGATYDMDRGTMKPLSKEGAPPLDLASYLVPTAADDRLVVIAPDLTQKGLAPEERHRFGATYDASADRWSPLTPKEWEADLYFDTKSRSGWLPTWTGTHLMVPGKSIRFLRLDEARWENEVLPNPLPEPIPFELGGEQIAVWTGMETILWETFTNEGYLIRAY